MSRRDEDERDLRAALNALVRAGLVTVIFDDVTGEDRYAPAHLIQQDSFDDGGNARTDAESGNGVERSAVESRS